jgi:hypothetical protein
MTIKSAVKASVTVITVQARMTKQRLAIGHAGQQNFLDVTFLVGGRFCDHTLRVILLKV